MQKRRKNIHQSETKQSDRGSGSDLKILRFLQNKNSLLGTNSLILNSFQKKFFRTAFVLKNLYEKKENDREIAEPSLNKTIQ